MARDIIRKVLIKRPEAALKSYCSNTYTALINMVADGRKVKVSYRWKEWLKGLTMATNAAVRCTIMHGSLALQLNETWRVGVESGVLAG